MKLHELVASPRRPKKRVGRGLSAGQGKTAGRGTKGQRARSGFKLPRRFEGGQSSFIMRMPKRRGFRSHAVKPVTVRLDAVLTRLPQGRITPKALHAAKLLTKQELKLGTFKIVGTAENLRPLRVSKEIVFSKALADRLAKLTPASKEVKN